MKAFPSFSNSKVENKPVVPVVVDLSVDRDDRRQQRKKFANRTSRKQDEVVFVDLPFTANYVKLFEQCITKGLSLNIKGILANLLFKFQSVEDERDIDKPRRVLTVTRRFASEAGIMVPQLLPNYGSPWYKAFDKMGRAEVHMNARGFREEIDRLMGELEDVNLDDDDDSPDQSDDEAVDLSDLLGMRAFKVKNENEVIDNIMCKLPECAIETADFSTDYSGQFFYRYAASVHKSKTKTAADKASLTRYESNLPPRPDDLNKGFKEGAAEAWRKEVWGVEHEHVLDRVVLLLKDPRLKRPAKSDYSTTHVLLTDQAVMDTLEEVEFFTAVGNHKNAGELEINRLANVAFGYNSARDAVEVLQLLLSDQLKQERKKIEAALNETPEAKAIKDQKKRLANEKRRSTIEAKNQKKRDDAAAEAVATTATAGVIANVALAPAVIATTNADVIAQVALAPAVIATTNADVIAQVALAPAAITTTADIIAQIALAPEVITTAADDDDECEEKRLSKQEMLLRKVWHCIGQYEQKNIESETLVPLGAYVMLKSISGLVTTASVGVVIKVVDSKRQKFFDIEVLIASEFKIRLFANVVKQYVYLLVKKD